MSNIVGDNLRRIRENKGYTIKEAAEKVYVSSDWLSKVERGDIVEPNIYKLISLADFYDTTLDYLYGRIEEESISLHIIDMMCKYIIPVNDNLGWGNSKSYSIHSVKISEFLSKYFNAVYEAKLLENKVPRNVYEAWIDGVRQEFANHLKNKEYGEFDEFALIPFSLLPPDMLERLESIRLAAMVGDSSSFQMRNIKID